MGYEIMCFSRFRKRQVFASYSSFDESSIRPIIQLLRVGRGWVFFAPDSIQGGDQWQKVILRTLRRCKLLVVFWCHHSEQSSWVKKEYGQAIELGKPVVPVLLDNTPLPSSLAKYQGIDFRGFGQHEPPVGKAPDCLTAIDYPAPGPYSDKRWASQNYRVYARKPRIWNGYILTILGLAIITLIPVYSVPSPSQSDELIAVFMTIALGLGLFVFGFGPYLLYKEWQNSRKLDPLSEDEERLAYGLDQILSQTLLRVRPESKE